MTENKYFSKAIEMYQKAAQKGKEPLDVAIVREEEYTRIGAMLEEASRIAVAMDDHKKAIEIWITEAQKVENGEEEYAARCYEKAGQILDFMKKKQEK